MKAITGAYLKTWKPAIPRRAPDNIVSSNYTTTKIFAPSYEKEVPRIEQLLTNDYQRIWWKEKRDWDEMLAEKTAGKKILPRLLVKKKVPTCATVKYQMQTGRWKGRKKQDSKANLKKEKIKQESNGSANAEKLKSATNNTKFKKCKETKLEKRKETQSQDKKVEKEERKAEREEEKGEERKEERGRENRTDSI